MRRKEKHGKKRPRRRRQSELQRNPTILWHYTTGRHYARIVSQGRLVPFATKFPGEGKPALWLTVSEEWEATAYKMATVLIEGEPTLVRLNRKLTHLLLGGLVRVGVSPEVAPHTWRDYKLLSGISPCLASGLYQTAIKRGSRPGNWRVSFEAVPKSQWLRVEFWTGTEWSTDPSVMHIAPPIEVAMEWIIEGLASGVIEPVMTAREGRRHGVRMNNGEPY